MVEHLFLHFEWLLTHSRIRLRHFFLKRVSSVTEIGTEHSPRICTSFHSALKFTEVRKIVPAMWKKIQVEFSAGKKKSENANLVYRMPPPEYALYELCEQICYYKSAKCLNSSIQQLSLCLLSSCRDAIVPKLTQLGAIVLCQQPITLCA